MRADFVEPDRPKRRYVRKDVLTQHVDEVSIGLHRLSAVRSEFLASRVSISEHASSASSIDISSATFVVLIKIAVVVLSEVHKNYIALFPFLSRRCHQIHCDNQVFRLVVLALASPLLSSHSLLFVISLHHGIVIISPQTLARMRSTPGYPEIFRDIPPGV